eukprot:TRINITY_DN538_c0_g2_i2.p1 TRINITY_DN538_c0_g2~~TRINITY_DN538_c0_g2_i2.p1  ORF type:complete len:336 (+),score=71.97 TRINITY_DN538_c0_g2_i2:1909-2916(+)
MANLAALAVSKGAPLVVQDVGRVKPNAGEVLLKTKAVASNPVDWYQQRNGMFIKEYPTVLGYDLAAVVEEIGDGVKQWKKGDRVFGYADSFLSSEVIRKGAYQEYVIRPEKLLSRIPDRMSFEEAVTITLPTGTAACSFYDALALPRPTPNRKAVTEDSPILFINNAASAVGHAAISLGLIQGFKVIASASPKNFEYILATGASHVFDYKDPDLLKKVKEAAGKPIHTVYNVAMTPESVKLCGEIITPPGKLALVFPQGKFEGPPGVEISYTVGLKEGELRDWWYPFLTEIVENGAFIPIRPHIIGKNGVHDIQKMLDYHASGQVSACKPVVLFE